MMASLARQSIAAPYAWALVGVAAASVVSFVVSFQAGVWLLGFLAVAWWAWQAPVAAFVLLLVIMPVLPMLKITQTLGTGTLLKDVLIVTLLVRLVVYPLWRQTLPYRRSVLIVPLVLLGVWTLGALLRADVLLLGVLRARDIGLYALLYLVALYLPQKQVVYRKALVWAAVTLVIVVGLAVIQGFLFPDSAVLRFDPVRNIWIPRVSSVLAHPSILGEYLVAWMALLGGLLWFGSRRVQGLALAGAVLILPVIYFTYSRAVWIGLVAAGVSMALVLIWQRGVGRTVQRRPQWLAAGAAAFLVLVVVAWQTTSLGVFVRSAFDPTYASNEERLEFLARLIAPMTNTEALVGRGLGDVLEQNFRTVEVTTFDVASGASRSVQQAKDRTLVDNQYLKTFVEMGLAGLLIYAWIYWRVLRRSVALVRQGADSVSQILGLWGVGFLAAFVVQAFFIDIWDIFPTNALFWIVAGLVSGHGKTTSV